MNINLSQHANAIFSALLVCGALCAALPAQAAVVWADWTITTLNRAPGDAAAATFSGLAEGAVFTGVLKSNSVAAAAASGAGGTAAGSRVSLNTAGGPSSITFSQAVTNPLVALWGLQSGSSLNTYKFNQTPTLVSGADFRIIGNEVFGAPSFGADGVVQFIGTFTSLTWFNQCEESSYLSVGLNVAPVPEPQTYALMAMGLGVICWISRRRYRSKAAQSVTGSA